MEASLKSIPSAMTRLGVNVLLIDEIIISGPTVAEILSLPYIVIATSVPHYWGWESSSKPVSENFDLPAKFIEVSVFNMQGPILQRLDEYRQSKGLAPIQEVTLSFPPIAYITQLPKHLDPVDRVLPTYFYYANQLIDEQVRSKVSFPWERFDGRRLIYVSLGTARTVQRNLFEMIAKVSTSFNIQLVLSLGGREDRLLDTDLPGAPIIVKNAPQLEIIKRADFVVCHGGLNTVLEVLSAGKPMIVLPISHDQPTIAAYLRHLKVAEVIDAKEATEQLIYEAFKKMIGERHYHDAAISLKKKIACSNGTSTAADVIERGLENGRNGR